MGVDIFEVIYDQDQAVYREGDDVTGLIRILNADEVKYKAIKVEVCGIAIVQWNRPDYEAGEQEAEEFPWDCNKEQYFQKTILLTEKEGNFMDKDPVLECGEHVYPFKCKLPPELPSSFEGKYGQIRYVTKAVIERPLAKSNVVTKKAFTVISGLNLNFISEAALKIELCKYKSLNTCCATHGSITIDWSVPRSGYVPGENICIDGAVQNESKSTVSFSRVILYMAVDYRVGKRKRREYKKINSVEKGETCADDITVWQESIHIPPVPPTGLGRCKLIDVNYELHFSAAIEGRKNPIRYIKDIYIGTVPMCKKEMKSCIAGMYNQPYQESTEVLNELHRTNASQLSLTHIVAVASAIEPVSSPTAPAISMNSLDAAGGGGVQLSQPGDVSSGGNIVERPPPFAPGSGAGDDSSTNQKTTTQKERSDDTDGKEENDKPIANGKSTGTGSGSTSENDEEEDLTHGGKRKEEEAPLNPSAPTTKTLQRPFPNSAEGIEPSFEETEWGPVSIRDQTDDTESLRGEFTYSPVYTYYNTMPRSHSN